MHMSEIDMIECISKMCQGKRIVLLCVDFKTVKDTFKDLCDYVNNNIYIQDVCKNYDVVFRFASFEIHSDISYGYIKIVDSNRLEKLKGTRFDYYSGADSFYLLNELKSRNPEIKEI